jgi:hypothetical protein
VKTWIKSSLLIAYLSSGIVATSRIPVGFYKPNRADDLVVLLKNKVRYSGWHSVRVTVLVSNQGLDPVLINGRMLFNRYPEPGEVSFVIEGPHGQYLPLKRVITPRAVSDEELAVLRPGESFEREVDLTDMYGVNKKGPYKIQAIYYNGVDLQKDGMATWRGAIASEPAQIVIE